MLRLSEAETYSRDAIDATERDKDAFTKAIHRMELRTKKIIGEVKLIHEFEFTVYLHIFISCLYFAVNFVTHGLMAQSLIKTSANDSNVKT